MARLPDEMVDRIKREISVERLAEARGIKLRRSGKELIGLCPFHKDTNPSLNIDPVKNVWHCKGACGPGTGGSVIDWVMRAEGISTRYALELLSRDLVPLASATAGPPPKQSTVPKLPPLFAPTVDDQQALKIVVNYYHETLKNSPDSPKAKRYLVQRGLESSEMIEHFRLGLSNRTLNYHVAGKNRAAGAEIRGRLEKLGILREKTGHEHFNGEELMNRAVVLAVNEKREQTRAIHRKPREAQTLEGLLARTRQNKIIKLHRNAQRLLRSIRVVNEHLTNLDFPDTMTRTRRDHQKFLTLISAIALLHQHQREIKTIPCDGETLEYIEATEADVKLAAELTNHVLVRSLDDVPPQTRRLLLLLDKMVSQECERLQIERLDYRFTRATVRRFTGWSDSQLKTHLHRLEELEYLALHRGAPGQSFVYALNFEMDEQGKPVLPGLSYGAKRARSEGNRSGFSEGVSGLEGQRSGSSLGQVWGVSGGGLGEESPVMTRVRGTFSEESGENAYRGQSAENRIVVVAEATAKPNGRMHVQAVK